MGLILYYSLREHSLAAILLAIDRMQKIMKLGLHRTSAAALEMRWRPVFLLVLLFVAKKLASLLQRWRASRIAADKPSDREPVITFNGESENEETDDAAFRIDDCETSNLALNATSLEFSNGAVLSQYTQVESLDKTDPVHEREKTMFEEDSDDPDRRVQELLSQFITCPVR